MDYNSEDSPVSQSAGHQFRLMLKLGDCHATVGNYAQAMRFYQTAATAAPDAPEPYVGLGAVAMLDGRAEDAELAFRVACRLDPGCSKAYAGLAMVCQQRGQLQQAFDLYLKSLELDSDNLTALLGLFQTSCQMGSFLKIIHYLQVYLDFHPSDTSVMFCLAALYVRDGRDEQARQLLHRLIDLDPENTDAANLLEEVEHSLAQREVPVAT